MIDSEALRQRFSKVLGRQEIYLANHSLGRPLDQTADDVREGLDLWYEELDLGWPSWLAEAERWRSNTARLLGHAGAESIVPKTSAGQGLRAVLNSFPQDRPVHVVTTTAEFDSIDFVLKTYQEKGRANVVFCPAQGGPVPLVSASDLVSEIDAAAELDLVVCSRVFFSTGQILEVQPIIEAAHRRGAKVLLDVYHAAGVIPLTLGADHVDFAIGGSYKYLRGGPGACWLAIHPSQWPHQGPMTPPTLDTGWFAKSDTFDYGRFETPKVKPGGAGWAESTPPVLMPYQARSGLELVLELGVEAIRRDSLARQAHLRERLIAEGLSPFVPADPEQFGAFVLLPSERPQELCQQFKDAGVNVDSRGSFVRLCPDFLSTLEELDRAANLMAAAARADG